MPIFNYQGIDRTGKDIRSSITSDNVAQAKQKIRGMGIMLVGIKEEKSGKQNKGMSFSGKVSVTDLAITTRQLATLIKAKIPIVEALGALMEQVENNTMRIVLAEVRQKVTEGTSFAKSLSDYPKIFNTIFVNMVEAGEASGTLDIVLLRLADFTESQMRLRNKIKGAMTYPVLMGVFGFIMMNVIFIFVIPKLAKIFESMKKELPIQTKICIGLSNFLLKYWWLVIAFIFVSLWVFKKFINSQKGQAIWHRLQLRLPILGILIKMINVGRFCSTLATLLNSGVPIMTALNIVKNLIPNIWMKQAIESAKEAVKEGASLATPLISSGFFPPLVTHMIKLGEKSGELEDMLQIVAENYQEQVDSRISGLTSILEPIMMIGLGVAVGFIVMSVIVPMMQMSKM